MSLEFTDASNKKKKSKQPVVSDPYAGQYPPPPPMTENDLMVRENQAATTATIPHAQMPQRQQQSEPFYLVSQASTSNPRTSFSSSHNRQSYHDDTDTSAAPASSNHSQHNSQHHQGHYYESNNNSYHSATERNDYDDPDAIDMREYLEAEREAKLRQQELERLQKQQQQPLQEEPEHLQQSAFSGSSGAVVNVDDVYRHHYPRPRPEPVFYNNNSSQLYSKDQMLYNSTTNSMHSPVIMQPPMFSQQPSSLFSPAPSHPAQFISPFRPPQMMSQGSNPSMMSQMRPPPPPPPPPLMMNEGYSGVGSRRRNGCCCFGISFCACFLTLIMVFFLLAGVALIVAAQIIGNKCTSSEDYANANQVLCTQTFHDGFLYGGIAVAAVSALIVIWRVVRWTCGNSNKLL